MRLIRLRYNPTGETAGVRQGELAFGFLRVDKVSLTEVVLYNTLRRERVTIRM